MLGFEGPSLPDIYQPNVYEPQGMHIPDQICNLKNLEWLHLREPIPVRVLKEILKEINQHCNYFVGLKMFTYYRELHFRDDLVPSLSMLKCLHVRGGYWMTKEQFCHPNYTGLLSSWRICTSRNA